MDAGCHGRDKSNGGATARRYGACLLNDAAVGPTIDYIADNDGTVLWIM